MNRIINNKAFVDEITIEGKDYCIIVPFNMIDVEIEDSVREILGGYGVKDVENTSVIVDKFIDDGSQDDRFYVGTLANGIKLVSEDEMNFSGVKEFTCGAVIGTSILEYSAISELQKVLINSGVVL